MNNFQKFIGEKLFGIKFEMPASEQAKKTEFVFPPYTMMSAFNLPEIPALDLGSQMRAARSSWVYACVTKIASELANIQLRLYKKTDGGIEEISKHEALDTIDQVNDFMTRYDLFELLGIFLESAGEAFWWKMKNDGGKPAQIYPWLNPGYMRVVPSPETFIAGYVYDVPGTGNKITFGTDEIIHFKYPDLLNPYRGLSPVKAAEYAIGSDAAAARWNYNFFKNAARPYGIVLIDGTLGEAQYNRLKAQMDIGMRGEENAHKLAILEKAKDYKEIGYSQKDMDFLSQREFSRDEIFAIFKVPKTVLALGGEINRATAETQKAVFVEETIVPKIRKIVAALNEFYLKDFGDDTLFFDFDDPSPKNVEALDKHNTAMVSMGAMTPNEVREEDGRDPYEGGDSAFLPINLVPQGTVAAKKIKKIKTNIKIWGRSVSEKVDAVVKEAVKGRMKDILSKNKKIKKIKRIPNRLFNREMREKMSEYIVKRADREEYDFRKKLITEFSRQEKSVLASVVEKELKSISFKFDVDAEEEIFVKVFIPKLEDIIARHGAEALAMVTARQTFDTQNERISKFLDSRGTQFAKSVNQTTKDKINEEIKAGIDAGEGIAEIRNRIQEVFAGARAVRAEAIARTEVSRSSNFATIEGYKQSGVVSGKEWLTAFDERTCDECADMDGKMIELDQNYFDQGDNLGPISFDYEDIEGPPLHVSCRCSTIPVIKD